MTREELKDKLLSIADSIDESDLKYVEWRDSWKEFIAKSIRRSMDNVLSFDSLLKIYEYELDNVLARRSRNLISLENAKDKMIAIHSFYRDLTNYVDETDMYKIVREGDKIYIDYRGQRGECIDDDSGQQMVLSFRGKEYGTGAYNFMWEYDMCGIIDNILLEDKLEELKKADVKK